MRPEIQTSANLSLMNMLMEVAPALVGDDYSASNVAMMALMLQFTSQEHERGADVRMAENKGLRHLLEDGAKVVKDTALSERLAKAAADGKPASLKISDLNAANEMMNRALIELHSTIEVASGEAAKNLTREIVTFLAENANRRAIDGSILEMLGMMKAQMEAAEAEAEATG
ncbi:MAG: hypothetical protein ACPG1C_03975 [Alphaproteobacteria bacterium]